MNETLRRAAEILAADPELEPIASAMRAAADGNRSAMTGLFRSQLGPGAETQRAISGRT
jgi:hypothetical protein